MHSSTVESMVLSMRTYRDWVRALEYERKRWYAMQKGVMQKGVTQNKHKLPTFKLSS